MTKTITQRWTEAHLAGFALGVLASTADRSSMSPTALAERRPDIARLALRAAAGKLLDPAAQAASHALADLFDTDPTEAARLVARASRLASAVAVPEAEAEPEPEAVE